MPEPLITIAEARQRVLAAVRPLPSEPVEISQALGRVLAQDVTAAGDVPPFACSAMDGYAVVAGEARRTLTIVGESRAGAPSTQRLQAGQAIRISTGAAVPPGATAIARQEDTNALDGRVELKSEVGVGEHVRQAGEDMRAGMTILSAGVRLGPAELGAAVAAGAGHVQCSAQPRVSVLCTGDELRAPGEPLGPGEIHNSNAPMLRALATLSGAVGPEPDRLPDDRAATEAALAGALARSDLVVISGGVSVGPHDHVKPALATLGVRESFWGVALQPGKPTWFGVRDDVLVFGLPGNPVSAYVTFSLFVAPALAAAQRAPAATAATAASGRAKTPPHASLATTVRRNPRREQAIRVLLEHRDGQVLATPNGEQGSHIVTSLVGADALALIPPGDGELAAGTRVSIEPLPC